MHELEPDLPPDHGGALCAQLSHKPNQISARVTLFAALRTNRRPDQWAAPTLVMIVV